MKRTSVLALVLVFASIFASSYMAHHIFQRFPRIGDEMAHSYQARVFDSGRIYIDSPFPHSVYWQPFLVDCSTRIEETYDVDCEGKRFSKYAPGWSLMLATGTAMDYPWIVNMWFAGLTIALLFRLGREMFDDRVGLVAALLMSISPLAIMLSGSLMAHTFSHFLMLVFVFALWRIEKRKQAYLAAIIGGIALGWLAGTRPLTAVGIIIPYIVYTLGRLALVAFRDRYAIAKQHPALRVILPQHNHPLFWRSLIPLLVFSVFTLLLASMYPIYNYAVTGKADANLYLYIWEWDQIGFGPDKGPYGHYLSDGIEKFQESWHCYMRDLYGWTMLPDNPPPEMIYGQDLCLKDRAGMSWILLPFGLLLFPKNRRWLILFALAGLSVMVVSMYYHAQGPGYGARYYYEMTGGLVLVSAAGVVGLARQAARWNAQAVVYGVLLVGVLFSLTQYTPDRITPIGRYPCEPFDYMSDIRALRQDPDRPLAIIAYGEQNACRDQPSWRDVGELMIWTDIDDSSEIVLLRDLGENYLDLLIERYQGDREIMVILHNEVYRLEDVIDNLRASQG